MPFNIDVPMREDIAAAYRADPKLREELGRMIGHFIEARVAEVSDDVDHLVSNWYLMNRARIDHLNRHGPHEAPYTFKARDLVPPSESVPVRPSGPPKLRIVRDDD